MFNKKWHQFLCFGIQITLVYLISIYAGFELGEHLINKVWVFLMIYLPIAGFGLAPFFANWLSDKVEKKQQVKEETVDDKNVKLHSKLHILFVEAGVFFAFVSGIQVAQLGNELNNNLWIIFVWLGFALLSGLGLVGAYYLVMFVVKLENKNNKEIHN